MDEYQEVRMKCLAMALSATSGGTISAQPFDPDRTIDAAVAFEKFVLHSCNRTPPPPTAFDEAGGPAGTA